jgi:muramidase (phage lysozyme)
MAEFNPFLPNPNIPDWTNAPGRLIDGSGVGEIFGKLAIGVSGKLADANDKRIQNNIYESAEKAAEDGRIGALADAAGVSPDLARSMQKADLYRKAFENGNFSDSTFYTKMDVWAKEMKSRYPNQKEIIDQHTQRVMGRTPANLELDSVRQQYQAEQSERASAAGKKEDFLLKNKGVLSPEEEMQFLTSDNPEVVNRLKVKMTLLSSDKTRLEYEHQQLTRNKEAGAIEAAPVLSQTISNLQREFYLGAIDKGGGTLQQMREKIEQMREGGFTPEEQEMAAKLIADMKATYQQKFIAATTTPGENGKSLQDYFASDPTVWNAQKAKFDEMLGEMDGLLTGKTGVFEFNATMKEAGLDSRARKLEEALGSEAYQGIKAMKEFYGDAVADTMLMEALQGDDPIQGMMNSLVKSISVKDGNVFSGIKKVQDNADPSYRVQVNKAARAEIEATFKQAYDKSLPLEVRKAAITSVLGDNDMVFFRSLKDTADNTGLSSREKMYKRMVDPEFAAAAKELGMEKQYTERLKSYGVALMETNVEQVNATNESSKYIDIVFNPNTQRYEATLNKSLVKDPEKVAAYLRARQTGNSRKAFSSMPQDIPLEDLDAIAAGMDSIQKLNMINEGLVLALKTEKPGITGEDLAKELQQYTGTLKASYSKKDPWTTRAWEAIKTHIQESTDGTVNKRLQKEQGGEDFGIVPEGDTDFNVQEDSFSSLGDDDAATILSFVSRAEGADYNTLFGGSKVILEEKTVAEVQQMQRAHGKKTGSSATGAYQVMRKTLSDLIDQGVVDPDEPFTEDVQNRIGMALLKRRGYDDWKAGKLSTDQFANRLALEWASLPNAQGKSAYEGVMGNKARTSRSELVSMLESLNT